MVRCGAAVLLILAMAAAFCASAQIPGEYLGAFEAVMHEVQGHAYATDDKTIFLHRFYYDGTGPPGVVFVAVPKGENDYSKGTRLEVKETIPETGLPEVLNKDLTLALPGSLRVEDVGRLVVWCTKYGVSFGRVDLTEKPKKERPADLKNEVGDFVETEHDVRGTVFIQDDETIVIRDFNYDGQGPSVVFYAGQKDNFGGGEVITYPFKASVGRLGPAKLKAIRQKDIVLKLPKTLSSSKLRWLSVWCDLFKVNFGHVIFP